MNKTQKMLNRVLSILVFALGISIMLITTWVHLNAFATWSFIIDACVGIACMVAGWLLYGSK
jgi:hypothetical protein